MSGELPNVRVDETGAASWDVCVADTGLVLGTIQRDGNVFTARDGQNLVLGEYASREDAILAIAADPAAG